MAGFKVLWLTSRECLIKSIDHSDVSDFYLCGGEPSLARLPDLSYENLRSLCREGTHAPNDYTDACGGAVTDKCQTAMNIAAIVGPMMKPLMPNTAMPPSVVIITT